jgi:methyltransferase (TIGR00027 family)
MPGTGGWAGVVARFRNSSARDVVKGLSVTDSPHSPIGVSETAFNVARARAEESQQPDRLFDDPLAAAFVAARGGPPIAAATPPAGVDVRPILHPYVAIRTRFFDDALLEATAAGIRQVVILGAGLDARAFRLPWPAGTRIFELDMPELFAFKEAVVAQRGAESRCDRVVVPVDLRHEWTAPLEEHGFARTRASAWLLEGLLMYFTQGERDDLLARIGMLAEPESRMALEPAVWTVAADLLPDIVRGVVTQATISRVLAEYNAAAATDLSVSNPAAWLDARGWHACLYDVGDRFVAYGRPVPEAVAAVNKVIRRYLATAERSA